jgi:hypothetical protein
MRILLIDDTRDIQRDDSWVDTAFKFTSQDDLLIARTYDVAIEVIEGLPVFDLLYLDHDLAEFWDGREYTGYDILKWLSEHPEKAPKTIRLVTANIVARKNMLEFAKTYLPNIKVFV